VRRAEAVILAGVRAATGALIRIVRYHPAIRSSWCSAWPRSVQESRQKTDVLVLQNGDRITGEIKGLSRGKLDYNTDDAGRPSIEWVKVTRLTSSHSFEVEVASGAKYFGRLAQAGRDGVIVVTLDRADTLPVPSVVRISPLNAAFLQRVTAYLDLGFSYAKANEATTFNLDAEVEYRGARYGSLIHVESYAQGQDDVPTTTRNTGDLRGTYYLPDRWSIVGLAQAEQNDELNLALRLTLGGGVSRVFRQSNSGELVAAAGVVVARERFQQPEGTRRRLRGADEPRGVAVRPVGRVPLRHSEARLFDLAFPLP
jgi:hypothetical protein